MSDLGRVRSLPRVDIRKVPRGGIILRAPIAQVTGYPMVTLCKDGKRKRVAVHTIVLNTFVGSCPPGMECLHDNDDRADPSLDNLSWGTRQQNLADRDARGRQARGERNGGGGKLTENDVRAIRALAGKEKGADVARNYKVTKEMIYGIWNNKTWRHVK
ncbi:hypothetical protein J2W79_005142 [Methylorubrum extorquens]|nr:hypothetical protein [Methylorubrum extorquens]